MKKNGQKGTDRGYPLCVAPRLGVLARGMGTASLSPKAMLMAATDVGSDRAFWFSETPGRWCRSPFPAVVLEPQGGEITKPRLKAWVNGTQTDTRALKGRNNPFQSHAYRSS
jgi:hypothetical protein